MQYFDIHTHHPALHAEDVAIISLDIRKTADILNHSGNEWYSIGVHPWYIDYSDKWTTDLFFTKVCDLAHHPAVAAIGETGPDKGKAATTDDFQYQQELFIAHARLSEKVKKPLIIHCVSAWSELLRIRQLIKPSMPWIIHGFRGKETLAVQLINAGFYLSFGCLYNRDALKAAWAKRRLLTETDDSKTNIRNLYQQIANDLSVSEQDLSEEIKFFLNCPQLALPLPRFL